MTLRPGRLLALTLLVVWCALTVVVLWTAWQSEQPLILIEARSLIAVAWLALAPVAWVIAWSFRMPAREQSPDVYQVLADKASDALLLYTTSGELVWRNAAAHKLFPEPARIPATVASLAASTQGDQRVMTQIVPVEGLGRYNVQALAVAPDRVALIVRATSEDSDRKQFYETFIRRIVHDMRNPLAGIIGHATNLRTIDTTQADITQVEQSAATIEAQAQRLSRLVDSMLFDARLAYVPLAPETLDLIELVEEALYTLEDRAATTDKHIALDMPPDGAPIVGDRDLLVRVFENLLDNALKYTADDGRVTIRLERGTTQYTLSFIDNGIGIAPEYLPDRIFQPLVRATRGPGGSGLGLSIAHKIIEMHGGTIHAQSRLNEGTVMTVVLPCTSPKAMMK